MILAELWINCLKTSHTYIFIAFQLGDLGRKCCGQDILLTEGISKHHHILCCYRFVVSVAPLHFTSYRFCDFSGKLSSCFTCGIGFPVARIIMIQIFVYNIGFLFPLCIICDIRGVTKVRSRFWSIIAILLIIKWKL